MSYIGNTVQNQNYVPAIDYFNGNGSTTAFTLSRPVASVAAVQAVINNVPQNPGSAFTVSGSTITFTSAPPSGTANIYVYYTSPNTQVVQPGQGTVGTTQLQSDLTLTNPTYTGTLTGGTGVVNIGSGQVYKDSSGNVGIGTSSPFNASGAGYKALTINGTSGSISSYYTNGSETGRIQSFLEGDVSTAGVCGIESFGSTGYLRFRTNNTERMRIDSSGNLLVGGTAVPTGTTDSIAIQPGANQKISSSRNSTASVTHVAFYNPNGLVGSINTSASATTYSTSSDYRLKENIQPMQNALGVVAQLNPVTYTWKADGSDGQGFIAHELQAVVPDCVTGEKDAVDEEGKPVYQGIDTSFLVATLTKAIQELEARVKQLEAK